jgi:CDGSH-type Zn-finger protein
MLPHHPRRLPHGDPSLELSLLPFGTEALDMFLRVEQPAPPGAPAEGDGYETIGQFYDAIEDGLRHLCDGLGEREVFRGDPARQVHAGHFRHTAGRMIAVNDLASALAVLEEIVEEGEGTSRGAVWDGDPDVHHPDRDEVAHYYRFQELRYLVYGGVPLMRERKIVAAENNAALTWQTGETLATEDTYALCRGGQSGAKPFCDGTHARVGFDGTESADVRPYKERQHVHDGVGISAQRVGELCIHAAFCIGRTRPIAAMLADTDDSDVRSNIMGRIDHCPSGSYGYALQRGGESIELDLPQAISVLEEEDGLASALWVTGGVPVQRTDGRPLETRNRMTLCRCGHSAGKPLCDGTHRKIDFREEALGPATGSADDGITTEHGRTA